MGLDGWNRLKPNEPSVDDAGFSIIVENFDLQTPSDICETRNHRIKHCGERTLSNSGDWFKPWYISSLPGWKQCVARSELTALALTLMCAKNLRIIVDSDYAANTLTFVQHKTLEELHRHHNLVNFDLYLIMHMAWHKWQERNVQVIVTKSHDLDNATSLLDRYYKLGNAFADYAAKKVTKDAGIVEFHQTRQSAWRYLDQMKKLWTQFLSFDHAVSQVFLYAHDQSSQKGDPPSKPEPGSSNDLQNEDNQIGLNNHLTRDRMHVLRFIDWIDHGDPLHRRRRMSIYGATYYRCLFAFLLSIEWQPPCKSDEFTTFLELYVCFLHCFGLKVGVRIDPKTSGYSGVFFQSPSIFLNLEDNRTLAEEVRLFTTSLRTLETMVGCQLLPERLTQASLITKRYSKRLMLYGVKAAFNAPGFRSATQTIEELCQIRHDGSDKQIAVLNLKQRLNKPFAKHFQNLICPEDCLSSASAQIRTWTSYSHDILGIGFKPTRSDVFARTSHLSLIKQTLNKQFPGDASVD